MTGTLFAVVALGLNLVYGTMRLINIAHGELVMVGAYAAFVGFSAFGISPLLCTIGAGAITGALGAALYLGLFQKLFASPALARRLEANSLLIFFGASVIIQSLVALGFSRTARGYRYLDTVVHLGDVALTANRLASFLVSAALCIAALLFLRFSVYGLAIKALIQRREAAGIVGIDVERIQLASITLGFATAGVAGALVSMTEQITPFMGFPYTITAFIVIILGGLGNLAGGIAAGMLLGFVEVYGVALTSASMSSVLTYGVFVGVLVLRPEGLIGRSGAAP